MTYSFYRLDSGEIVGRRFGGPHADLAANTPAGCAAIEGALDRLSQRVDVATGEVVGYQRPASEIEAEQRSRRHHLARKRIADLERAQQRALREFAIDPANAEARRRIAEIDEEIGELRSALIDSRP